MSRIVVKTAHAPYVLEPTTTPVKICMCGLSKDQPFCSGMHVKTQDEEKDKTYKYSDDGSRKEVCGCCSDETGDCECNDCQCK